MSFSIVPTTRAVPPFTGLSRRFVYRAFGLLLISAIGIGTSVEARPILTATMRLGLSVNPDYWYVLALGDRHSEPTANLTDPHQAPDASGVTFMRDWDYLIRIKPINPDGTVDSSIQAAGGTERPFEVGFNEVRIDDTERPSDTVTLTVDLSTLTDLSPEQSDIHVSLATIANPLAATDPDRSALAIDATRGQQPHFYPLSLSGQRQVVIDDPQRQETLRRSRDLLAHDDSALNSEAIAGETLDILAANIVTFELSLDDR